MKKTTLLFLIFAALYMLDGYLATQFAIKNLANEANPIARAALVNGNLYLAKVVALAIFFGIFTYAQCHHRNTVPIYYGLITMLLALNFVSWQMIG